MLEGGAQLVGRDGAKRRVYGVRQYIVRKHKNMKRIIAILTAALLGMSLAGAQNAILAKIEKTNQGVGSVECDFSRTKTLPATGKVIKDGGVLWYTAPDRLNMTYDHPKEALVINGNMMFVKRAGKPSTFDTSKNTLMKGLRDVLLNCIAGKVETVIKDHDATFTVKEVKDYYNITMTPRNPGVLGYSRIALTYRKADCVMLRMETVEVGGITEVIKLEDVRYLDKEDASKFVLPRK